MVIRTVCRAFDTFHPLTREGREVNQNRPGPLNQDCIRDRTAHSDADLASWFHRQNQGHPHGKPCESEALSAMFASARSATEFLEIHPP